MTTTNRDSTNPRGVLFLFVWYNAVMKFTIIGNQEDDKGNPIPYHRSTQGGQWKPAVRRYHAWKDHVVSAYCEASGVKLYDRKPIPKQAGKIYVDIKIFYKDKTHADSDNIAKGINDALFENDKYVAGSYDFEYDKDNPRVEVTIRGLGAK